MLIQSKQAQLMAAVAVGFTAGLETINIYTVDLSAGITAADDIVEIAMLPAYSRITGIDAIGVNTGTGETADVGILSGNFGDTGTRTMATVLMNDVTVHNATAPGVLGTLIAIPPTENNRSIGVTFSANIAAGAGKSIQLVVRTINA